MTTLNENIELNDELEDEDDDWWLFENDDWEDSAFPTRIANEFPGWHQLKISGFTSNKLREVREWCTENVTRGGWKDVGWSSGCSYSVGVVIENAKDAMLFKLRWS